MFASLRGSRASRRRPDQAGARRPSVVLADPEAVLAAIERNRRMPKVSGLLTLCTRSMFGRSNEVTNEYWFEVDPAEATLSYWKQKSSRGEPQQQLFLSDLDLVDTNAQQRRIFVSFKNVSECLHVKATSEADYLRWTNIFGRYVNLCGDLVQLDDGVLATCSTTSSNFSASDDYLQWMDILEAESNKTSLVSKHGLDVTEIGRGDVMLMDVRPSVLLQQVVGMVASFRGVSASRRCVNQGRARRPSVVLADPEVVLAAIEHNRRMPKVEGLLTLCTRAGIFGRGKEVANEYWFELDPAEAILSYWKQKSSRGAPQQKLSLSALELVDTNAQHRRIFVSFKNVPKLLHVMAASEADYLRWTAILERYVNGSGDLVQLDDGVLATCSATSSSFSAKDDYLQCMEILAVESEETVLVNKHGLDATETGKNNVMQVHARPSVSLQQVQFQDIHADNQAVNSIIKRMHSLSNVCEGDVDVAINARRLDLLQRGSRVNDGAGRGIVKGGF